MIFVLCFILFIPYSTCDTKHDSCVTELGERGRCTDIHECHTLLALVTKTNRSSVETEFLRRSQCGVSMRGPKVCCPDYPCLTPDGLEGECINVRECHLYKNLKQTITPKQLSNIVNSTRCKSKGANVVCCPPITTPSRGRKCVSMDNPPDKRTGCCGDNGGEYKIIWGEVAMLDQYPWMAILEYMDSNNNIRTPCAGVLISSRHVLTAANCVKGTTLSKYGQPVNIRLDEFNKTNDGMDCVEVSDGGMDCNDGTKTIPIESITPHPLYNPMKMDNRNNIAIITLKEKAPYTDFIRPICLPSTDWTLPSNLQFNFWLKVAGWGTVYANSTGTNELRQKDLLYVSNEECREAYKDTPAMINDGHICAKSREGDACKFDSGGPLMRLTEMYELVGVFSFGIKHCGANAINPSVYTKVFEHVSWIKSVISIENALREHRK